MVLNRTGDKTKMSVHPSTKAILKYFEYKHLPSHLQAISIHFYRLAHEMLQKVGEGPEVTVGLRKLLEAKDCFVRAALPNND